MRRLHTETLVVVVTGCHCTMFNTRIRTLRHEKEYIMTGERLTVYSSFIKGVIVNTIGSVAIRCHYFAAARCYDIIKAIFDSAPC